MSTYRIVDFAALPAVPCPCGSARRALADEPAFPGTLHVTQIRGAAQKHYHRSLTETYYILRAEEGSWIELDDDRVALRESMAVVIPPGVAHRIVGNVDILNIVVPNFDPMDEVLVDSDVVD